MFYICYRFKKFRKSRKFTVRTKIRILLNSEQFLLIAFFKKMVISAKKVCFLHFSYLPASASKPNCINNLCSKSRLQNGKEFDPHQVPPRKNSGKKPDPENPKKSGYQIHVISGQILRMDTIIDCFME